MILFCCFLVILVPYSASTLTRSFLHSSTNSLTNQPNVAFRHEVCALGGLRHSVRLCAVGGCIVINYLARKGNKKNRNSQISLIFCGKKAIFLQKLKFSPEKIQKKRPISLFSSLIERHYIVYPCQKKQGGSPATKSVSPSYEYHRTKSAPTHPILWTSPTKYYSVFRPDSPSDAHNSAYNDCSEP